MKKKISLLIGVLVIATSSMATAFTDVLPGEWYYREVTELRAKGITRGYEDGTFRPNRLVSNSEALTMILRAKGVKFNEDPEASHWAEGAISKGLELGIVDKDNFERDRDAKREEVIEMIVRALELEDTSVGENHFVDSTNKYANILYGEGLIKGEVIDGEVYLKPERAITRAEMGALTVRIMDYIDIQNYDASKATAAKYFEFDKATGSIIGYSSDGPKEVVIPEVIDGTLVRKIESKSFYKKGIRSLLIPNRVSSIGDWAFAYNDLDSLIIPSSVSYLGKGALYANQLSDLTMSDGLLNIDDWAFGYNKLSAVYVPSSVRTIGVGSFYGNGMERAELPKTINSIGNWAFDQSADITRY